ncbi:fungal-specific transcription factor domain-containing protein [Mycena epipterygia]|nr:fungal-specific transcription factor domain-containing protein [Mycena epipterygia]
MAQLTLANHDAQFLGLSSGARLVRAAVQLKVGYTADEGQRPQGGGERPRPWGKRRMEYWTFMPWKSPTIPRTTSPSQTRTTYTSPYIFPPPPLLSVLIDSYFAHSNTYVPLLHRPTFMRGVEDGLHLRHDRDADGDGGVDAHGNREGKGEGRKFGACVMLVCAVGARFSSDAQVFAEDGSQSHSNGGDDASEADKRKRELSCGWAYFTQVWSSNASGVCVNGMEEMFLPPTLYDLQRYCLSIQFLEASAPQANWALIGIGLRMAQEVGAHRRRARPAPFRTHGGGDSSHIHGDIDKDKTNAAAIKAAVESELWTRAFWVLMYYDRMVSSTLGRPCGVQYEDFDLDLPIECDDEYWPGEPAVSVQFQPGDSRFQPDPANSEGDFTQTQAQPFKQPKNKPSKIAFFNAFLRLNNILAFTLRILYSLTKAKAQLAVRDDAWEEHLVAELDSALNKWVDSIPRHLQWDAHRADPVFFAQSVVLYCGYYHVQMMTHRPFIPMVREAAPTALPSLAICTNAARSCSHIADVSRRRMGGTPVIILLPALTTAGVVLLLNVWSGKRTGLAPHMNTAITEVHKLMQAIRVCESRWQMAGLYWDILNELASVGHVPLPAPPPSVAQNPIPTPTPHPPIPERTHGKRVHEPDTDGAGYTRVQDVEYDGQAHAHAPRMEPILPADDLRYHHRHQQQHQRSGFEDFQWTGAPQQQQGPALPMYTADLGRLPVYQQQQQPGFSSYAGRPGPRPSQPLARYPDPAGWADFPPAGQAFHPPQPVGDPGDTSTGTSTEDFFSMIDHDALAMWANAPMSLGAEEWGTYFSVMNDAGGRMDGYSER